MLSGPDSAVISPTALPEYSRPSGALPPVLARLSSNRNGMEPMSTPRQRRMAAIIKTLASLFRKEDPGGWIGLRAKAGQQPSIVGANLFLLACSIDGQQREERVNRVAQRFVFGIVPKANRPSMWKWIVANHTPLTWRRKKLEYGLHHLTAWHDAVYDFARFIESNLDGDPRRIWRGCPPDVIPMDYVRTVFHLMGLGPARSRMTVGALRDHRLITGSSDFKDDIHVRRGMKRLGLARSDSSDDVLSAGREFFGQDSWVVDLVLYRLGKRQACTRTQVQREYQQRIVEKRDKTVRQSWAAQETRWREVVRAAANETHRAMHSRGWGIKPSHADQAAGFLVHRTRGRLSSLFMGNELYIWNGIALDVQTASVQLLHGLEFHPDSRVSGSKAFRNMLVKEGYDPWYDDRQRWETHYRILDSFRYHRNPDRVGHHVSRALVDASLKAELMLGRLRR